MIPIVFGIICLAFTVALHAVATTLILAMLKSYGFASHQRFGRNARPLILSLTATSLAVKHYLDIIIWAVVYCSFADSKIANGFPDAVYFSSVTYTTLGYGDIVLTGNWRLACGVEAMNGVMLFGWSTALMFVLVQRLWGNETHRVSDSNSEKPKGGINE